MNNCQRCGHPRDECIRDRGGFVMTKVEDPRAQGLDHRTVHGPSYCWACLAHGMGLPTWDTLTADAVLEMTAAPVTSPREVALSAAAQIMANAPAGRTRAEVASDTLDMADKFAAWLTDSGLPLPESDG